MQKYVIVLYIHLPIEDYKYNCLSIDNVSSCLLPHLQANHNGR